MNIEEQIKLKAVAGVAAVPYEPATGGWKPLGTLDRFLPAAADGSPMRESRSISLDRMGAFSVAAIGKLAEQNKLLEARLAVLEALNH